MSRNSKTAVPTEPKVCFLLDSFYPILGGGENHARLLAREMTRQGTSLFVLTRRTLAASPTRECLDGYVVHRVAPTGQPRLGKYLMMGPAFWFLARCRRTYDVIYVCGMRTMGLVGVLCARLFGKKCILRAESCDELRGDHIARHARVAQLPVLGRLPKAWLRLRNRILMRADRFLAISSAIEAEYRSAGVAEEKIVTIPNGIDTDAFVPATSEAKRAIRDRLALPDKTLVMYTGKLNRGKGLEGLLRAWTTIAHEFSEAHLVLVGSGAHQFLSCEPILRAFVRDHALHDRVTFAGATHEVAAYLKAADIFVMPSESESQCIALIEAMAVGLPAVATAVGGIPEYFVDGCHGTLVAARNEAALAQGLRDVLQNPEAVHQGRQARAAVLRRFQIDVVAQRHRALFREVLLA